MNSTIASVLSAGILLAATLPSFGQPASGATFTRVTTDPIATDAAHSFGCAWGDFDNDGFLDLMVGNGLGDANALYHNERDGTFTRVVNLATTTIGDSDGVAWGDYDNDGDEDLFVANYRVSSFLFRNDGNWIFTRIIDGSMGSHVADSIGCAWGDYDNDGWLDLLVGNQGSQPNEYCYRNNRDGSFTQLENDPLVTSGGESGLVQWLDYDDDGDLDAFVGNFGTDSWLFQNDGHGNFSRLNALPGSSGSGACDWVDYDNDGDLDLFVTRLGNPGSYSLFYRNDGGSFTSVGSIVPVKVFGASGSYAWGDYDNDGWLDLFVSNYRNQNNFLFRNNKNGDFTQITTGRIVNDGGFSVGCAWGDYDNDGFLDLFVANGAEETRGTGFLYRNDGNANHWLSVVCKGRVSNRSGIGAKVRVLATIDSEELWQMRDISSGSGYGSARPRAHFGLGDATNAAIVRIQWPSGIVQELRNVQANRILTVKEPPVLTFVSKSDGADGKVSVATLSLKGGQGISYAVERSTNLVHWDYLTNVVATNIVTFFNDGPRLSDDLRFYRAREDD